MEALLNPQLDAKKELPEVHPLLEVFISRDGFLMGLDGDFEVSPLNFLVNFFQFQIKDLSHRGFGSLHFRDTVNNFRVMQVCSPVLKL